jgi:uncharacterized membrane protein YhdT
MNEIVIDQPMAAPRQDAAVQSKPKRAASELQWYLLLTLMIVLGWLIRDYDFINPEEGTGYWLGITGGSMMLLLLLYPLRKRIRLLHSLGPTKHWFRMHMILGLLGPLAILYHCNFQIGSFNSQVALYCMLLVAGSGIIGRHFYARIHRGLYGRKTSLKELQAELAESVEKSHGLSTLMPGLVTELDELASDLQGCQVTQSLGVGRSLRWTFSHTFMRLHLLLVARRELRAAAAQSEAIARDYKRIRKTAGRYIRDFTNLTGRVAQFSFYERLFALWHILHLPIFFMMILSALVHVLAVHMY